MQPEFRLRGRRTQHGEGIGSGRRRGGELEEKDEPVRASRRRASSACVVAQEADGEVG